MENSKKTRVTYRPRIVIFASLFVIFYLLSLLVATKVINKEEKRITYWENGVVDYKVYLKENDFYEQPYLKSDMAYIASLIDSIKINFKYDFTIDEPTDLDVSYDVVGKLVIRDSNLENTFFEKEYILKEAKKETVRDQKIYHLEDDVSIDYGYYNSLANRFKTQYGVDTTSYLEVTLKLNEKTPKTLKEYHLERNPDLNISIPLSERAINIMIDHDNENSVNEITNIPKRSLNVVAFAIEMIILVIAILLFLILIYAFLSKKKASKYDSYIKKILKEYDRLIVETSLIDQFEDFNVIQIDKFSELLDVHDNLKLPIMYYSIYEHEKCWFYIKHNHDLYLHIVTSENVENEK